MKKRVVILLIIYVNLLGALMAFSLFSVATGKADIVISGIATDSDGRVYVGCDKGIEIYDQSELVRKMPIPTSRGYKFTIVNDRIILSDGDYIYTINSDGEILDTQTDSYENHVHSGYTFKAENGDIYRVKSFLFRTKIVKNDNTVAYRISNRDLAVKLALEIAALSVVIGVPCFVSKFKKSKTV
ncbi:MAG TPA: hypothetical protein DCY31_03610 [Ruminococcaceae bacterium]|nr:hypothetical protein [Oscillospiraceae bacterium]